ASGPFGPSGSWAWRSCGFSSRLRFSTAGCAAIRARHPDPVDTQDMGNGPLEALMARVGHDFRDRALLARALTHPSYLPEHPEACENNQRLEFLGDAVLQLILTESLFELYPGEREGGLSKRRAALTKGAFLAELAREAGLDACLRLGASEETTGGRARASTLEDAFEALVGALYIDGGLPAARRMVAEIYGDLAGGRGPSKKLAEEAAARAALAAVG